MTVLYQDKTYMTDDDLEVQILGSFPKQRIKNRRLRRKFKKEFGRDFLGGDDVISYIQPLVSGGIDFNALEESIIADLKNPKKPNTVKELVFQKTATGIGRGHSLGGLAGVSLGISGTKMIDSGLTGLVMSRSLITSSRRRETTEEDIAIPEVLLSHTDLLNEYLDVSKEVFSLSKRFKKEFGSLGGVQTFNKIIPYNNPANLDIILPLDTMATLAFEVEQDKRNPYGNFVPREIHTLVDKFHDVAEEAGMGTMYEQRIRVPRDTYLHYTVFKDPSLKNEALVEAEMRGMPLHPLVIDSSITLTIPALEELERLEKFNREIMQIQDPEELYEKSKDYMLAIKAFVGENNESVRIKVLDSLSWRVWSEQKRHATLRQNVESIYSAAPRSANIFAGYFSEIEKAYEAQKQGRVAAFSEQLISKLEEAVVIDDRLKKSPELLIPYLYFTGRQLNLFQKMLNDGVEMRDALYIVPKDVRLRTMEHYDLINLIDLEFPLRTCSTCEPEREATSWEKREVMIQVAPELEYFLSPKCNVGFCTEGNYCVHLTERRKYNKEFHKAVNKVMLDISE